MSSMIVAGPRLHSPIIGLKRFIGLAVALVTSGVVYGQDYAFRSEDRPAYANTITLKELQTLQEEKPIVLLDVRLIEDYESDPVLIPGATYRNPEDIADWSSELPEDARVVVYCVRGKWVSQKAATFLNQKGLDVQSLQGGIEAWKAKNIDDTE